MTVAQHIGVELLTRLALLALHVVPSTGEIPHCLLLFIWHPHRRQTSATQRLCQLTRIPPVGLDTVTRLFGISEGATT